MVHSCRETGESFDPAGIRQEATSIGEICFAFACANIDALTSRVRDALTLAGFTLVHCQRLRDVNGGKDTTDEQIQDLIRRFLNYASIAGVVLVSDDRNFAPIMNGILDRKLRCIRLTLHLGNALDTIGETRQLSTPYGHANHQTAARRWAPDVIIDDIYGLKDAEPTEVETIIRRITLRAPFVMRLLGIFIQQRGHRRPLAFRNFVASCWEVLHDENRAHLNEEELEAFITELVRAEVVAKKTVTMDDGGERTVYAFNRQHPVFANALSHSRAMRPLNREESS